MAGRSSMTLKKRQKEMARAEKQRDKIAKRLDKQRGVLSDQPDEIVPEDAPESTQPPETATLALP